LANQNIDRKSKLDLSLPGNGNPKPRKKNENFMKMKGKDYMKHNEMKPIKTKTGILTLSLLNLIKKIQRKRI
jgi:hypothetical protein